MRLSSARSTESLVRHVHPDPRIPRRSFAKAISWRITGSIDTFVLSWLITGNAKFAGTIASTEVITKILLFYFHERAWAVVRWGKSTEPQSG